MRTNSTETDQQRRSARKAWDAAIEAKIAAGMNPANARATVAREQPELRRRLLDAFNSPPTNSGSGEAEKTRSEFEAAIAEEMETRGLTRQQAASSVVQKHPQLRDRMVAAANA